MSCLEKDRDKRPATVQDIMAALDAISVDEPWTDEAAEHWWCSRPSRQSDSALR